MKSLKEWDIARILITAFMVLAVTFIVIILTLLNKTTIYNGVSINGIEVGGLNRLDAVKLLEDSMKDDLENREVTFNYEDYTYLVKLHELGITYDYYKAADDAYGVGREGNALEKLKDIYKTKFYGRTIEIELLYNRNKINSMIDKIEISLNKESKNAEIQYKQNKLIITPEVIGKKVNSNLLYDRLVDNISFSNSIDIPVEEQLPNITSKLLKEIKEVVGGYNTSYKGSSQERVHNIKLSASAIDGKLLLPGEVFSFNEITGERNVEAGYQEAKVILDGNFIDGIGGGVCQVSTTLYNAALLSDLEITERHHHSIPSTYVAHGQDATVAYDYLDLKFKNNYDTPVYLHSVSTEDKLTITIFGKKKEKNLNIKIQSVVVEKIEPEKDITIDDSLQPGEKIVVQQGRYGYRVKTYKITYKNNVEKKRELISTDFYKPNKSIIRMGPESINVSDDEVLDNMTP